MKTANLYIRVSTDEQADKGYSQRHQEEQLRKYCVEKNIEVLNVYKEDYSAKTFNRPEIKRMLVSFKITSNRPNLLLFTKWDRFSREISGAYDMISTLDGFGIEPQAIEQPLDISIPENQLILAIYLAAPMAENLRRGLNVVVGMRKAMKEGRVMGMAPRGYKNGLDSDGKKRIYPNEDAKTIIWIFNEIYKAVNSPATIRRMCNQKGFKISRSRFYLLIRDPVYCGNISIPAYKNEEAIVVKGIHEPLISEELFDAVQDVLNGRVRKIGYKVCAKPELPLRGFVDCPQCGGKLTGSASKGGSGIRHFYYHCKDGCPERVQATKLNEAFSKKLNEFEFHEEAESLYQKIIKNLFGTDNAEKNRAKNKVKMDVEKLEGQLDNMRQKLSNNEISSEDFLAFKNQINPKLSELKIETLEVDDAESELKKYLKKGIQLVKNIGNVYHNAPLDEKQKIVRSIFRENIVFKENVVRTGKLNEVMPLIGRFTNGSEEIKKGTKGNLSLQSLEVPCGLDLSNFINDFQALRTLMNSRNWKSVF